MDPMQQLQQMAGQMPPPQPEQGIPPPGGAMPPEQGGGVPPEVEMILKATAMELKNAGAPDDLIKTVITNVATQIMGGQQEGMPQQGAMPPQQPGLLG